MVDQTCDVVVVGAGPSGLMLGANLARFGVKAEVLDERCDKTSTGRADGMQPKTLETFRQMRLLEPLLQNGVKFYDMTFWNSDRSPLRRTGRETHYPSPSIIDVLDPYMLLGHQGMVEDVLLLDMKSHGVGVTRNATFTEYSRQTNIRESINVEYKDTATGSMRHLQTTYVVGCDGAHSKVRRCMRDADMVGETKDIIWGVLDGEIDTEFPDLWSKAIVHSEKHGTVLCIPRERNMTRLYIELVSTNQNEKITKAVANQDFVMTCAREIFKPYQLEWKTIEWFGLYQIGQRVANRFTDEVKRVFICGDAAHTHSPKAGQGMNVSMHDSWNLAWKLNLAVRGLATPVLLPTYEAERRKIALDLINFDNEHAAAFSAGDPQKLVENFATNTRFISGVGADYDHGPLNEHLSSAQVTGDCKPGKLLTPAKVTRYVDHNPVDLQLDIPHLGQFRRVSAAAGVSYMRQPRPAAAHDEFSRPERYLAAGDLFTLGVVTAQPKDTVEIADLPPLLRKGRWTFYLDNVPEMDTKKMRCLDKWVGGVEEGQVGIVNIRPDGYVGSVAKWDGTEEGGKRAISWLENYYRVFLREPSPLNGAKVSAKL
ncbi:FAD/NAD P-binding domain-containing protein [Gloeophyllum trabeum ATCC 11539]|uniref:FAD/NAD P-binding domain-containing protein n=1 Tax=Gloeophyllum trabeum (strain ATCC 11539 / FP-39264 / Madison 617) TaxID=670483 RepID=S7RCH8_GLOTA|nr:FAD/NAD P-binding domain-containing protein [Gloeophyllum trabeum ATCC 11539]EPQ51920.1 FAD/NAD P-binding domain-containing protein [Gloeophyllum trabeum ATCC 11539]